MADVLISYASEDRDRAGKLAAFLSARGWSVWWDRKIIAGEAFDNAIERELESAKSVVVLWSKHSIQSEWVKNEASVAAERGVLVPASIDQVKLPLEFRRKQTVDLAGWQGDPHHGGLQALCEGIAAAMGSEAPLPRAGPAPPDPQGKFGWRRAGIAGSLLALGLAIYAAWSWQDFAQKPPGGELAYRGTKQPSHPVPDEKPRPKPLTLTVSTREQADRIDIRTAPMGGLSGRIRACLQVTTKSGWWKGIGLNESAPTLAGEKSDGVKCTSIAPGLITIAYWKAKAFGVRTQVGSSQLDLRQYKDHEVVFTWQTD